MERITPRTLSGFMELLPGKQAKLEKMISAMGITVDDIMDQSGLPLLGLVPEDESVPLAAAFRKPLLSYEKKGAAAACKRIAKRIQGNYVRVKLK